MSSCCRGRDTDLDAMKDIVTKVWGKDVPTSSRCQSPKRPRPSFEVIVPATERLRRHVRGLRVRFHYTALVT